MTCRRAQFLIQSCVDGAATRPERELLDSHLDRCAGCARVLAESRQLVSLLAAAPRRTVSDSFDRGLTAAAGAAGHLSRPAVWWDRFRFQFEWRVRTPAMITAGSLAAAMIAAVGLPQVQHGRTVRAERGEYVAKAVERHQQIEQSSEVNWDALDASIQLSTGATVTE